MPTVDYRTANETEVRRQAARTLAGLFDTLYDGAFAVDMDGRVTWMNQKFRALLGWNGTEPVEGKPVEEIIPESRMRHVIETGEPNLIDIFPIAGRQVVVSRIPLTDAEQNQTGAMGIILFDRVNALKPLVAKFHQLQQELAEARQSLAEGRRAKYSFSNIVGQSAAARTMKRQARHAAERDAAVLLLGETGTGKELLAHAIHAASRRGRGPMVRVNLAAIPETLLEAELFGAAPGAYTGAGPRGRPGKFELANGGTLFLDEVGDLPVALQPKLLRVLDDAEIEPLGGSRVKQIDLRIIAATSRDLQAMVAEGAFRADLYYRLNVLPVTLPPLRERREDLPMLAEKLLDQIRESNGVAPVEIAPAALARLTAYDWPGNIRELRNVMEQAATAARKAEAIGSHHLADWMPAGGTGAGADPSVPGRSALPMWPLREVLMATEKQAILAALDASSGVRVQAAKLLGISRAQFYEKLHAHGIDQRPPARRAG